MCITSMLIDLYLYNLLWFIDFYAYYMFVDYRFVYVLPVCWLLVSMCITCILIIDLHV